MKNIFIALAVLLFGASTPTFAASNTLDGLEEFHIRGGLPNFFKKIGTGKEVRIAYIGGSITEARDGWRDLTFNWFRSQYPLTPFVQIDATIGGTGSDLGVFRMDKDVLSQQPDLVFVEFAVNDYGRTEQEIRKTMEGIVRKTWKQFPAADICFTYTIAQNVVETMQKGAYQHSAIAMERIAEHYQIPSIHMGVEVVRLLEAGKLIFTGNPEEHPGKVVFTQDRTHPLSLTGHPIYANSVIKFMQKMEGHAASKAHTLPLPVEKDNWELAQMIPLSEFQLSDGWEKLSSENELRQKFVKFMPDLFHANPPGASFTVKFKGSILGIYDVVGPKTGLIEVTADGQKPSEIFRFDQYCKSYRKSTFFVQDLSDGVHEVTFRATGKEFDKAEILKKKNITITDPADYAGWGLYLNSVLLVGELMK
ncbi:GDSL-like lipase/acylhydrolase family protein [Dyadobacter jejuensis]|uniref:GDSL-like lipase/acylhydrolase family protein n=1 Tax=Dyadobacter jejuensis TaxID=1082580 RepID=A0A316AHZ1_9BACT|nr:SGNH/GDSL hydrolase family protein [Dyadobacter jejuensis]PWJ56898.1 GDSL-like lipase/acylhydrolase family protein [Dyadobacter jejuensis]